MAEIKYGTMPIAVHFRATAMSFLFGPTGKERLAGKYAYCAVKSTRSGSQPTVSRRRFAVRSFALPSLGQCSNIERVSAQKRSLLRCSRHLIPMQTSRAFHAVLVSMATATSKGKGVDGCQYNESR